MSWDEKDLPEATTENSPVAGPKAELVTFAMVG